MLKAALVGAVALATVAFVSFGSAGLGISPAVAQDVEATGSVGPDVTEAKIARLKHTLHLTAEQAVHWHPVESALRRMVQASRRDPNSGLVQRVRAKVSGYTAGASAYQEVANAAGPLIATLDDRQRHDGMRLIREFGFGQ
ncbi:MAG: hypothetical protein ACXWJW_05925 [Xanthobacteraceae bacterium]